MKQPPNIPTALSGSNGTLRPMPSLVALPFNILEAIGRAGFHGLWYLLFVVGCAFRAFTALMVLAAIVMLPMALGVFVNPSAAPMPWWTFLMMSVGMLAFAIVYNRFLDWFTPPGATDPFDRYRPSVRRKP